LRAKTVANSPQARKRAKQNSVRRLLNHSQRSSVRTAIKKLEVAIIGGDQPAAQEAYKVSASMIDKATVKGLHHKNRAARLKSRLNKRVKEMAA
jgi:small subunit ribosomal protein S20